jgi:hypothetical protein
MAVRQLAQVANEESERRAPKSEVVEISRGAETLSDRIRRLQWEASVLAAEQSEAFAVDLAAFATRALEIAEGGDAYPAGVRELASRIASDLTMKAKTISTILHRNGAGS